MRGCLISISTQWFTLSVGVMSLLSLIFILCLHSINIKANYQAINRQDMCILSGSDLFNVV